MSQSGSAAVATWGDVPCDGLGGNDVLRYEYELVSANDIITGSVESKSVSFRDLRCQTKYIFRVRVVTNDGKGPFSTNATTYTLWSEGTHAVCDRHEVDVCKGK